MSAFVAVPSLEISPRGGADDASGGLLVSKVGKFANMFALVFQFLHFFHVMFTKVTRQQDNLDRCAEVAYMMHLMQTMHLTRYIHSNLGLCIQPFAMLRHCIS